MLKFRLKSKRWRRRRLTLQGRRMQTLMYVKCALSLQQLLCYSLAAIFAVSFLYCNTIFSIDLLYDKCKFWTSKGSLMYIYFFLCIFRTVCKPCSLACTECPICRSQISDRIITFTWCTGMEVRPIKLR